MNIFKKSKIETMKQIEPKSMKICMFFGISILRDLGRVLGGFGDAKILDFRSFFDVISKQYLKRVSMQLGESKNLEKVI